MKILKRTFSFTLILTVISFFLFNYITVEKEYRSIQKIYSSSSAKGMKYKKGRSDYFERMLRDPKTKTIPHNIRQKELVFAEEFNKKNKALYKGAEITNLTWQEAGPKDVGGRTRALAVDITNPNIIISGGASGGIWKSTDKGVTWNIKSTTSQILSVTSVAQDVRNGNTNVWYYASGEFRGSAQDQGFTHRFSGGGIYKSTDNGESWNLLDDAKDTNPTVFNTPFDFVSKIIVSPITGSVFIASHPFGILKSGNGGDSFDISIGDTNEHIYSDIDVTSDGTLIAVLSSPFEGTTPKNNPGVYKSTNDGQSWTNITPASFPQQHMRSVIKAANNNTAYVLTFTGSMIDEKYDDVRFHKINIVTGTSEDRSANMPNFLQDFEDFINTQQSYNMVLAVKPDDENFVLIGGTSLFRSTNGFSSKPNNSKLDWIGGYHPQSFFYPDFHPDVHSFSFEPNNPNAVWWGHDGGLSYTPDIRSTNYSIYFPWQNKNNGYNITQFYTVAIPNEANDNRIMGGTQDNGTPFFTFNGSTISESEDLSSGDGSYNYWGDDYCYVSVQNGIVLRVNYDNAGKPSRNNGWSNITPQNASNQLFINPYAIDPNNENIMLYPAGNTLWRNNQLNSLPMNLSFDQGMTTGWAQLNNASAPFGYIISALAFSDANPQHRLYYSAVDFSQTPQTPKIYRLDNAHTSTASPVDISISGLSSIDYIHNIAVNPDNGNELLVIISNYNVKGIYHSLNGGDTFTEVEGNLEGTTNPGPSIRGASIIPTSSGTQYFVGTSTGVYSTLQLNGVSTNWVQEGSNTLGNVIVNYIASRKSDGRIVAGTHGRGAFVSQVGVGGSAIASVNSNSLTLQSRPGESGSTSFILSNNGAATLTYNISVTGSFAASLAKVNISQNVLYKADLNSTEFERYRKKSNFGKIKSSDKIVTSINKTTQNNTSNIEGDDPLFLDDGNSEADSFVGWGNGNAFNWYNEFNLSGFSFEMDSFEFFMRTENAFSNDIYAGIYDQNFNLLSEGNLSLALSENGTWYKISLNPSLSFPEGESFYIELYSDSFISNPAGADFQAQIPNKSFYFNGVSWINLNTISGFENGAFLIRAIGTKEGGGSSVDLVTVNPASGSIAPGNSQNINLTLNAQNLNEGTYTGEVNITTNGGNITIPIDYLVDVEQISNVPTNFSLSQNYPNPFNPSTIIEFSIPRLTNVSLKVFDALGKEIVNLVDEEKSAGQYKVTFDAKVLSSGIYFYRLDTDGYSQSRKMILIK